MRKKIARELLLLLTITLVVVVVGRVVVGFLNHTNYKYQYINCYLLNKEFFPKYGEAYFVEACGLDELSKW